MRLGLIKHDTIAVAEQPVHYATCLPPKKLDRSHLDFKPGMYGNDVLPDCTAAGIANSIRGASWVHTGADTLVVENKVTAFYAECVGAQNNLSALEATDGARILDVLKRAADFGFDGGQQVVNCPRWHYCNPKDQAAIADAALTGGVALLGVDLADADQFTVGEVWDTNTHQGDQTPGGWGPHCLGLWDWEGLGEQDTVRLVTWGGFQKATWRWVYSRLMESWFVSWPQMNKAS